MKKLTNEALAKSTRRVYKVALREYENFCSAHRLQCFPLRQSTLHLYSTHLTSSLSYKSIKLYLVALKYFSLRKGYRDQFPKMHKLHLLLRGIKCCLGAVSTRKPRFLVTIPLLKRLRSSIRRLCPDAAEQQMLWAACTLAFCTLAFFSFLGSSEYTPPSTVRYHRKVMLQVKDVTLQK